MKTCTLMLSKMLILTWVVLNCASVHAGPFKAIAQDTVRNMPSRLNTAKISIKGKNNKTIPPIFMSELVTALKSKFPHITILDTEYNEEVLDEMSLQLHDVANPKTAPKMGKLEVPQAILFIDIQLDDFIGNEPLYKVVSSLVDVETGETIWQSR